VPWRALIGFRAGKGAAAALDLRLEAGIRLFEAGDLAGAESAFRQALREAHDHPKALHLLGVTRLAAGHAAEAERLLRRCVDLDPSLALGWFNLGNALRELGREADAAVSYDRALAVDPAQRGARFNLALIHESRGALDAAIATATAPGGAHSPDLDQLQGRLLHRRAQRDGSDDDCARAIECFGRALASPGSDAAAQAPTRLLMADALMRRGQVSAAFAQQEAAHAALPDDPDVLVQYANGLNRLGRVRDAAPYLLRFVRLQPAHLPAISSAISAADYRHNLTPSARAAQRDELMRAFADPLRFHAWPNPPARDGRLRIGYVSPDFRDHAAMTLLEPVLRAHDRSNFEVFAYDAAEERDARNRVLRTTVEHWREIDALDIAGACDMIRADAIDILVDLAGHTAANRLMVFARKPAPVQVSWLGYPGSTGLPEMDYLLSDRLTSPPPHVHLASEEVIHLPATRLCYCPPADCPAPVSPSPGRPLAFGSFNNPSKLNPEVLGVWKRVLDAVPGAVLVLKYASLDHARARDLLWADLHAAGIDIARVTLRGASSHLDALAEYADIDIALDPWPYCGGLTSLDALWMGVPVVTLEQEQMAGRQTLAFLALAGMPELIAPDADAYVRIAAALAADPSRRAFYRKALRPALEASPLLDFAGFTRALEAALRGLWQHRCERQPGHAPGS
jgi:predicted O-linked N-acetylglucosamine transferase (SPINDLY family)